MPFFVVVYYLSELTYEVLPLPIFWEVKELALGLAMTMLALDVTQSQRLGDLARAAAVSIVTVIEIGLATAPLATYFDHRARFDMT